MRKALLAACIVMAATALGWSQEFRATLTGRVTDPQGAVVPAARVAAVEKNTGARHETRSSSDGQYTLPFLPPGTYQLTVEATGFKRYVRDNVRASTNERLALDIQLELGPVAQTMTVTGEQSLLEVATASTGQVVSARQIGNMPLNGRTPLVLAQLAFGVIPTSDPRMYRPFDNNQPSNFSVGGAPSYTSELLLDGAPDAAANNRVAYNPPVDAVEEVKVESFQADAAFGHTGGGTVNVVLKGGTNAFHGAAYDFNQVSKLAATPFFTNRAGLKNPVTRYNQWGANAGGPVVVPRLFNGRNKVFFLFAYEGIKDSVPEPITTTVPTEAMRRGDLSQLLQVGSNYQLYDPATGVVEGSRIRRQPFAGNVIPEARLSPIAKAYFPFYPLPNQPGRPDAQDNYLANSVRSNSFNSELGRLDLNLSDRHKLYYNFRHNERLENRGNRFNNLATGNFLKRVNWGTLLDDVYTFTPTTVLNARLNWTRFADANRRPSDGFDFTTLGFPAALRAASQKLVLPRVNLGRFNNLGDSGGDGSPQDSFQLFASLTRVSGKHSLKFGADLRLYRASRFNYGNSSGAYDFSTNWTRGPLDNSTAAPLGQELAALLLGLPTGGSFDLSATQTAQNGYQALFVHDDFRVRPNLTLNLGLRYERDLPSTERFDRSVNGFDATAASPISAAALAAYTRAPLAELPASQFKTIGGLVFAGPGNRALYETRAHYFSPRLGAAWRPAAWGGKTAVRGGVGVFIFPIGVTPAGLTGVVQSGFSQATQVVPTLNSYLTPNATLANPFPNGIEPPTGSKLGLATFLGRAISFPVRQRANAYSVRWSLDLQRELPGNVVAEAGYLGNHSVHLPVDPQRDFVPSQFLSTAPVRDQAVIDRLTANVANPFRGLLPGTSLNGSTIQHQSLLDVYPHFTGVTPLGVPEGSSYFHMLQVRVEKRFSGGLQALGNYLYSKLIERRSRLNDSDPFLEKRIAEEDRPQRLVLSGSWELPFGADRAVGSSLHPALKKVIGGWTVNAIYTLQPGPPLAWGNVLYYGGDLGLEPRRIDGAFDTSRFNTNSREQLASNLRTFPTRFANLRADGANNMDFSVIKATRLVEVLRLEFRCEFFNVLNHPSFNAPGLSPTSSNFGQITSQANLPRSTQMALRLTW